MNEKQAEAFKKWFDSLLPFPPGWWTLRLMYDKIKSGNYGGCWELFAIALEEDLSWRKEFGSWQWYSVNKEGKAVPVNPNSFYEKLKKMEDSR